MKKFKNILTFFDNKLYNNSKKTSPLKLIQRDDLLLYGDAVIDEPGLLVPHPQLHARAFVLVPLAEIAPGADVPGRGRVEALLDAIDVGGIVPA